MIDDQDLSNYVFRSTKINKDIIKFCIINTHTRDKITFKYMLVRPSVIDLTYKVYKSEVNLWKKESTRPSITNAESINYIPDEIMTFTYYIHSMERNNLVFHIVNIETTYETTFGVTMDDLSKPSIFYKSNDMFANVIIQCNIMLQLTFINCTCDTCYISRDDYIFDFEHEKRDIYERKRIKIE